MTGGILTIVLGLYAFGKTKFVMDRGFYSEDNINGLYKEHVKFLVGVKLYAKFFEVKDTPARGRQVYYKEDEIKAARRYIGYFALITNEKMDAFYSTPSLQDEGYR